ncbi:MAG: anthranilate phosphoribosyltransferase [Rhodospirillaceae bacterium]
MTASPELKALIARVTNAETLSEDEARQAFDIIMSGAATPVQISAFLTALRVRGETVAEITGAARVMREKATPIKAAADAIDVVGTGGDGGKTWNISTAAAIVCAACGLTVAKHGNRAASSKSGSADVLAALGVNLDAPPAQVEQAIAEAGIGFMFAQRHHSAMRHVGPVRVELGIRTIFNLLGPLSNPAGAKRFLLGVFSKDWVEPLAHVLGRLGTEKAWVVHGADGLDEVTTTGATFVSALENGTVTSFEITPEQADLSRAAPEDLKGDTPEVNAAALTALLDGETGAYRDIVLMNTAAALIVAGKAEDLAAGVSIAADAIDSGRAKAALAKMVAITNATPPTA